MPSAQLFPPEVFVDHLLVAIRDADFYLSRSALSPQDHARQSAALAHADACPPPLVAAAVLSGVGELLARSWARHPAAAPDTPIAAADAASAHLSLHLPPEVTEPIRLLSTAHHYLHANEGQMTMSANEVGQFESERHARQALALARIDRRVGAGPMITPPLDSYRELLFELCTDPDAATSTPNPSGPPPLRRLSA